jgi:hypothetical protein
MVRDGRDERDCEGEPRSSSISLSEARAVRVILSASEVVLDCLVDNEHD